VRGGSSVHFLSGSRISNIASEILCRKRNTIYQKKHRRYWPSYIDNAKVREFRKQLSGTRRSKISIIMRPIL
jgi:hypothetical protein